MDFVNPGAAASLGIQEYLMQRRANDRQDRIDALNAQRTNLEIQQKQEEIKNAQQDRAVKLVERRQAGLMPGDIPDQSLIADSERVGLPLPTKVEDQYTPLPEGDYGPGTPAGSKTIFLGSPQQRMAQQQQDKLVALVKARSDAAREADPMKAIRMLTDAGEDPAKIHEFMESRPKPVAAAPTTQPVYRVSADKTKIEEWMPPTPENPAGGWKPATQVDPKGRMLAEPQPIHVNTAGASDDAPDLTDAAVDLFAKGVAKGQPMPALGSGNSAKALRTKIMNRSAEYDPTTDAFVTKGGANPNPADLAGAGADYAANKKSLGELQPKYDAAKSFSDTAEKNQKILTEVLSKVPDTGIRGLNGLVRSASRYFGNEDMTQFNVATKSLNDEYARLISQPTMTGVLTDAAREDMKVILDPNATGGQIVRALTSLSRESGNRVSSFNDQIQTIRKRISPPATSHSATETPEQRKARLLSELTGPQ